MDYVVLRMMMAIGYTVTAIYAIKLFAYALTTPTAFRYGMGILGEIDD